MSKWNPIWWLLHVTEVAGLLLAVVCAFFALVGWMIAMGSQEGRQ